MWEPTSVKEAIDKAAPFVPRPGQNVSLGAGVRPVDSRW
jgi:hypothetical protein